MLFFLLVLSLLQLPFFAQTYNMSASTQTTCSGTFYDHAGTGNYSNSQNTTMTFKPGTCGKRIRVTFTAFNTESGYDFLRIYNASSASNIIGTYSGTQIAVNQVFTSSNIDGALTFNFTSDGSTVSSGWVATVSCVDQDLSYMPQESAAAPTNPSACNTNTANMGPGSWQNFPVTANTDYTFTLQSNPGGATVSAFSVYDNNGTTVLGNSSGGTVTVNSGSSTNLKVLTCRAGTWAVTANLCNCFTNAQSSAVLNYKRRQPGAVTVSGGGAICAGASQALTASGGTNGTMYWQNTSATGTSIATPSTSQSVSTTGTYYFGAANGGASGCWTYGSAAVTVSPTFSNGTVSTSGSTSICYNTSPTGISTSGATGSGSFSYQWYSQAGLVTPTSGSTAGWTSIAGQTGTSLTASAITANTTYACWVTPGGSPSCGSANWAGAGVGKVQITVSPNLSLGTTSTGGSTNICYNTAPTGISTSGATGSGSFTYQWYSQAGLVTPTSGSTTGWTSIAGQTGTSLTASAITANTTYACWVIPGGSPSCGSANWAGASNNDKVQITVQPNYSTGTVSTSGSTTICYNTTPTGISTTGATGSGSFTYQWYSQAGLVTPTSGSTSGWTLIGGQTGTSLTASALTSNTTYACWVTPGGSPTCGTANWAGAGVGKVQITVLPSLSLGTASTSGSTTICYNTAPTGITTTGATGSGSFTYQWYSQAGLVTPTSGSVVGWTSIAGQTGTNLTASAINSNTTYACYVTPAGSPSCGSANWAGASNNDKIQITVLPAISKGTVSTSGSTTICYNSAPTGISTTGATGSGSYTYQWYSQSGLVTPTSGSTTGWTSIAGQTGTSLTASAITSNTTYACYVTPSGSPSCGTANWAGASNNDKVQITVLPNLSHGTVSTSGLSTICYNSAPTGISTTGATGSSSFTYQWYSQSGLVTPTSGSTSGWTIIAGQTGTSLTASAITSNTTYACWVTPGGSTTCGTANWAGASNNDKVQITVLTALNYGTTSTVGNTTICNATAPTGITTTTAAGSSSFSYQWYYQTGFVTPTSGSNAGWTAIVGQTGTSLTAPSISANTTFACWITPGGSTTCGSANWAGASNSDKIQITVRSAFSGGTLTNASQTICYNTAPSDITYSVSPSGGSTPEYQWYYQTGTIAAPSGAFAIGSWTAIGSPSTSTPTLSGATIGSLTTTTTFALRISDSGSPSCYDSWSGNRHLVNVNSVFASGTILSTGETICNGGTPSVIGNSVAANGGDGSYTYSWRSSSDGYISAIIGATSSTYTPPAGLTSTNSYRRYVNDGTCNTTPTVSTGTWTVTVQSVPTAGSIGSDQTICNGSTPSGLTSSSAGGGDGTISYRWESSSTSSSSGFSTIVGATSATYSPGSLSTTTWYRRFTVSTMNSTSCESVATSVITITVQSSVTAGTIGSDQTICNGDTPVGFTSSTPGTGSGTISYRWENSTTSSSSGFSTIGGATSSTYSPGTLTADNWYRRYSISTQNGIECESAATSAISIAVQSIPTAGSIGTDVTICNNTAPSAFTNTASGTGTFGATISYRWESSTTSSSAGFSTIGGATSATYTSGALTVDTWFRRITISTLNSVNCESAPTTAVKVTVQSVPTAGTIGSDQTICNNTSPTTISNSSVGTGSGTISYRWESSTTSSSAGFGSIAGSSSSLSPSALTSTTWFRRITISTLSGNACESIPTTAVQIIVQNAVTAGTIGSDQTLCNGSTPTTLSNSTSGTGSGTISYRWESSTTSSSSGFSTIGGATSATYSPSSLSVTTWYRRYAISTLNGIDCESVASNVIQITIQGNVTAGSIGSNQTICYNTTPTGLTSSTSGTGDGTISYFWELSTTNSSSGFSTIVGAVSSTYSPSSLTQDSWYRRSTVSTLNGNACTSTTTTPVQITVRPNFTPGSISTTGETICSNIDPVSIGNITLASGGDNSITYEWRADGTPIASTNSSSYDPLVLTSTTTFTRWAKDATCNTSFTQSTGSWIVTVNNPVVVSSLSNNDFVWVGTTDSDWATASNWLQWNSSLSIYGVPSSYPNSSSANVILPATGGCIVNAAVSNGNTLTVNNLTIESGHTFALNNASAILNVNGTLLNNGTWTTPTTGSTVNFIGSGSQTIPVLTYYNLSTSTGGTKTLGGNITANGIVTIGASTTLNLSSYSLTLPYVGTPLIKTGTFTASTGTVIYNGTGTQSITGTTYYNLTTNGSGSKNLGSSTIVSNSLDLIAGTLVVGANTLTINGSTVSRTAGSIDASNVSSTLIFGNSSTLTLPSSIFSTALQNLTLSGNRVVVSSDFTVNGTLNLNNSNPDATNGLLDLVQSYGSYANTASSNSTDSNNDLNSVVLTLGSSATTTGSGDVTGKVRRTSFSDGVTYTFGNANMQVTFNQNSGTLPSQLTVVSTKGSEGLHVDKDGTGDFTSGTSDTLVGGAAVKRLYQIMKTGGTSNTTFTVRLPYEDSQLNGNTEANLVIWDHQLPHSALSPRERGKTTLNTSSNYLEWANVSITSFANEDDASNTTYWMIAEKETTDTLWIGAAEGSDGSVWNNILNWSSGAVPSNWSRIVVDPVIYDQVLSISGSHQASSLTIRPGGIVNGGSGTLTLNGSSAWSNNGTFNSGTSTVIINNSNATMSGNTKFYNLSINSGKKLTMQTAAIDTIMNELTIDGQLDATTNSNTIVFGGEYQVIPSTNNASPGFYNLVIDQTNGASAYSADVLNVMGDLTIQNGILDMYSNDLQVRGDFINNGSLLSSPTVWLNGTGAQSIEGTSSTTFTNLNIDGASGTVTTNQDINIEGTLTINSSKTLDAGNAIIELRSGGTPFINDGTFNENTSEIKYVSTDPTDIANVNYYNLTSTGAAIKTLLGNTVVENELSIDESTIDVSTFKLSTDGLTTSNSGKLNVAAGELDLTGTSNISLASDVFESSTVNILTLSGVSDISLGGDLTITGELNLPEGTLKLGTNILTVESNATLSKTNGWLNPETSGSIIYKAATLPASIMPSHVVPNLEIDRAGGTVVITGDLEINGDFKMSNGTIDIENHTLKLSGNMIHISGEIDADAGTVDFNNSAVWNLPTGFFAGNVKGLTVNGAGGLGLADDTRVTNTLTMNGGDVTLSSGKTIEIGSSKTNVGSVAWSTGTVVGPMKRWFAASTNSSQESGIFPVGTSTLNRYAQINFTSAPEGGYLIVNFHEGLAPDSYSAFPIQYTDPGNTLHHYIQNADELGYWEMTPYSESGDAYGALDNTEYDLFLRLNNPYSISHGGVLSDPPRLRLIRAKGNADGSHGDWTLAGTHEVIQAFTAGEDYKIGSGGVVGFSWFNGGGDNQNPLPVELLSFTGNCSDDLTKLTWQTASEFNSAFFEVQSSRDGENWFVINNQPSAGTSFEKLTYSYESDEINEEMYYRLRQVDINGMDKVYDPIVLGCNDENTNSFKTQPNPSDNNFKVVLNNKHLVGKATLRVIDTKGTVISEKQVDVQEGVNMFFVNENVAPGIYYINISNDSYSTEVIKQSIK